LPSLERAIIQRAGCAPGRPQGGPKAGGQAAWSATNCAPKLGKREFLARSQGARGVLRGVRKIAKQFGVDPGHGAAVLAAPLPTAGKHRPL